MISIPHLALKAPQRSGLPTIECGVVFCSYFEVRCGAQVPIEGFSMRLTS
jgi:hypothetical protein